MIVLAAVDYQWRGEISFDALYGATERRPPQVEPQPHSRYALQVLEDRFFGGSLGDEDGKLPDAELL
jgi:hypothetical protein